MTSCLQQSLCDEHILCTYDEVSVGSLTMMTVISVRMIEPFAASAL